MSSLDFEGLVNARDVGGVKNSDGSMVKSGLLFRSETPQLMTDVDVERAVAGLGVVRVVDLRSSRFGTSGPLGGDGRGRRIDFFEIAGHPTDDAGRSRSGFLPGLLDRAGPVVGLVLDEIVGAGGPTWVHCHTGKDRTGFVIAVVLAVLGVEDDEIVADYNQSSPVFEQMMAKLDAVGMGVPDTAPAYAVHAPSADGVRALLHRLRTEWPSPEHYLISCGVAPEVVGEARSLLIESPA